MNGLRVKRKQDRAVFTITGQHGGLYILTPEQFGTPISEPVAGLHEGYTVVAKGDALPADEPAPVDEHASWQRLAEASHEAAASRSIAQNVNDQAWDDAVAAVDGDERHAAPRPPTRTVPPSPEQFFASQAEDESEDPA